MLAWRVTLRNVETKWMSSIVFAVICKAKIQIKIRQVGRLVDFLSMCLMCDCLTSLKSNPHKHEPLTAGSASGLCDIRIFLQTLQFLSTVQKHEKTDWRL